MAKNFKVDIKGVKILKQRLDRISAEAAANVNLVIVDGCQKIEGEIKDSMRTRTSSGRSYKRTKSGLTHTSSAEGSAPNPDLGTLLNSANSNVGVGYKMDGLFSGEVGSFGLDYAKWLERGTSRMAARPWLVPAFKKEYPGIYSRMIVAINKGLAA